MNQDKPKRMFPDFKDYWNHSRIERMKDQEKKEAMNQDKTLEQQIEAIINKHIDWSNSDNISDCKIELARLIREKQCEFAEWTSNNAFEFHSSHNIWTVIGEGLLKRSSTTDLLKLMEGEK